MISDLEDLESFLQGAFLPVQPERDFVEDLGWRLNSYPPPADRLYVEIQPPESAWLKYAGLFLGMLLIMVGIRSLTSRPPRRP